MAVPANDSLGLDQDQMLFPVGDEAPDQHPEEPVSGLEVRARTGTKRDVELVPQEQVLRPQGRAGCEKVWQVWKKGD